MTKLSGVAGIVYANGDTFQLPEIRHSGNGWVYKPDSLRSELEIKRGKNKVWPRTTGDRDAGEFLVRELERHFNSRNWEKPSAITNPVENLSTTHGPHYKIGWNDPVFGWTGVSLQIQPSDNGYRNSSGKVTWELNTHVIAEMLLDQSVSHADTGRWVGYDGSAKRNHSMSFNRGDDEREGLAKAVKAFKADPWGSVIKQITEDDPTTYNNLVSSSIHPPPGIKQVTYESNKDGKSLYEAARTGIGLDDNGFWSEIGGNADFFEAGYVEQVLKDSLNWVALSELVKALRFCGVQVSVESQWEFENGERVSTVSGFTINIPKQGEQHHHNVRITSTNADPRVEIECGYENDERLWVERKQRQAAEQMRSLETELTTVDWLVGTEE